MSTQQPAPRVTAAGSGIGRASGFELTGSLADDTFRRSYAKRIGVEESTLREHAVLDPAATVTRDVERLRSAPEISPRVTVSGHVYESSPA